MKIYITKIETADREEFLKKAMPLLSEDRRKKTEALFSKEDKMTSAAAGLLLGFAIDEFLIGERQTAGDMFSANESHNDAGVRLRPVSWRKLISGDLDLPYTIAYKDKGKPYFTEEDAPEFNLSHSGNIITLVLSDRPVGIDVEKRRPVSDAVVKKAFSVNDAKWIYAGKSEEEVRSRFLRAWTVKEAYHKMLGESVFSPDINPDFFEPHSGEISEKILNECFVVEEVYDMYTIAAIRAR